MVCSSCFVGHYIYMEGSFGSAGDEARLISPELRSAPEACITFWYNMYGYEMGNLSLFLKVSKQYLFMILNLSRRADWLICSKGIY